MSVKGSVVTSTAPRPDWNQKNPTKADFIMNKEFVDEHIASKDNPHGSADIPRTATGSVVVIANAGDLPLQGLNIYGKTTQNGTPTPSAPIPLESVGDSGSVGVTVAGKNLFGGDALADKLVEVARATKDETAGTVMFSSGDVSGKVILENCFKENTQYTFIFYGRNTGSGSRALNFSYKYTDGTSVGNQYFDIADDFSCYVYTSLAGKTLKSLGGAWHSYSTILEYNKCGVFEGVLTEADFEPYKGQTATFSAPDGLHGIGEVKDEIDLARGVRVQRIGIVDMGTLSWEHREFSDNRQVFITYSIKDIAQGKGRSIPINAMCELYRAVAQEATWVHGDMGYHSPYGKELDVVNNNYTDSASFKAAMSGVVLLYELATPIETPLTAEELAQYAALHTNKPNTTVFNDGGAEMEIRYCTPNAAVPMNVGSGAKGKALGVDEHGCVVPMASWHGLGGQGVHIYDCNISQSGFYRFDADAWNRPFDYGTMIVSGRYDGNCNQIAICQDGGDRGAMAVRQYGAAGAEWEHINPRMTVGVEYKTTERWNGKSVYTKLIDFGAVPNNTHKGVQISSEDITGIAMRGYADVLDYGRISLPYKDFDGYVDMYFDKKNLILLADAEREGWKAFVQVWYIK